MCTSPGQVTEVVTTSDPEVAFQNADVAVLLGGFPRLPVRAEKDTLSGVLAACRSSGQVFFVRERQGNTFPPASAISVALQVVAMGITFTSSSM